MAKLSRTPEEPHGITNKVGDYHKSKNLELQRNRDKPQSNGGTTGRALTQPDTGPTCTFCNNQGHGSRQEEQQGVCPAYNKTCNHCGKQGHFRAAY